MCGLDRPNCAALSASMLIHDDPKGSWQPRQERHLREVNSIARSSTSGGNTMETKKQLASLVTAKCRRCLTCLTSALSRPLEPTGAHSFSAVRGYAAYLFRHTVNFASCIACPRCVFLVSDQSHTRSSPTARSWHVQYLVVAALRTLVSFCIHCSAKD